VVTRKLWSANANVIAPFRLFAEARTRLPLSITLAISAEIRVKGMSVNVPVISSELYHFPPIVIPVRVEVKGALVVVLVMLSEQKPLPPTSHSSPPGRTSNPWLRALSVYFRFMNHPFHRFRYSVIVVTERREI